jgi:hypothetical protein
VKTAICLAFIALVDAVIAWENLVGSRDGEPTLRIAAPLAWLLARSAEQRKEIMRRVAEVYRIGSDIVHGNRFLTPQEALDRRREALDITLDALRVLFKRRSELLDKGVDGSARTMMPMLNQRS